MIVAVIRSMFQPHFFSHGIFYAKTNVLLRLATWFLAAYTSLGKLNQQRIFASYCSHFLRQEGKQHHASSNDISAS